MTTNDELLRKIREVSDSLEKIERKLFKRGLSFEAAIPPFSVCRDIIEACGTGNWDNHMQILADYYGVTPMGNYHDENGGKVGKKTIACYHSFENAAYYAKPTTTIDVVLHEFFHHLVAKGVVVLRPRQKEEHWADRYAQIVMKRDGP